MQAFDATRLNWPMDWTAVFGRSAPLFMEIGFGNAQFLIALAQRHPEANIIGVEISLPSIKKAERKAHNLGLTNVRVVHGDARLTLWGGMPPASLTRLYLNFPDPWHKAAHHERKLINGRFLHLLATRMVAGGLLEIATDDAGYQEHIAACLEATPYFTSTTGETFATEDNERLRTKYELKALAEGRTCHYYHWQRNETTAENLFPTPQEIPMPHAILQSPLSLAEMNERYTPQSYNDELPIRFIRLYESGRDRALLVETHVAEDPLPQRVALFIQGRTTPNEYIIGLHEIGFPRPTVGIHHAIAHLARWVIGLDERTVVLHHNLASQLVS
ncbi:MAG: tRNA (guanosine(46)-N7)-methyltransferase TrmB [Chloroflexi bacterium]|nr:tRNA (guanosine(46)-N7)-methyltransferase TrmB [Chloroflexota bacterium]